MRNVLLVEDEPVLRREVRKLLEGAGYMVVECETLDEARAGLERGGVDVVVSDLRLPGGLGTDLLPLAGAVPLLLMTGYASVRSAVDAMKRGAADYLPKPFDPDELLAVVARLVRKDGAAARPAPSEPPREPRILGTSPAMDDLRAKIARVAATDVPVLVLGESGTGKELVARALHDESARQAGPFVAVNCAAIPESLVEAELFGSSRGAFTGATSDRPGLVEAAARGTLFLDEIGEVPLAVQARLLRFLQESEVRRVGDTRSKKVDVRVIAATHRDLPALVRAGTFREDLYYRLRVMELTVPPLRARGDDVLALARAFVTSSASRWKRPAPVLSRAAEACLARHSFPGNVRELENAVARAVVLAGEVIEPEHLALVPEGSLSSVASGPVPSPEPSDSSLESYFVRFVRENQDRMNEIELAAALGISRKTLWERRLKLGVSRPKPTKKG
jgi:two-component system response regulator AtoC